MQDEMIGACGVTGHKGGTGFGKEGALFTLDTAANT